MRRTPKILEAQEPARGPLSPCQVWRGSDYTRHQSDQKVEFFVCVSVHCCLVCLSVMRLQVSEVVRPISPVKRWSTETILIPLDRGSFVLYMVLNFLRLLPTGNTRNYRSSKQQNWGFSPLEGGIINRSRRNLARKRILWVYPSTQNYLAFIGKRGRYRSHLTVKNCPLL